MKDIRELLQEGLQGFSKTQKKVAVFLLDNSSRIKEYELNDIAEATGVSRSTVLRFFKDLGFNGYRDLKQHLISLTDTSDADPLIEWILNSTEWVVKQTATSLDHKVLDEAIERCASAERLFWYGVGESGLLAEIANYRSWLMGIESSFCREMSHFTDFSYRLGSSEVLIVISLRGDGDYLYQTLEDVKNRGIFIIGLTSNRLSWLAENASLCLFPLSKGASIETRHVPMRAAYEALYNALILGTAQKRGIPFRLEDNYASTQGGG